MNAKCNNVKEKKKRTLAVFITGSASKATNTVGNVRLEEIVSSRKPLKVNSTFVVACIVPSF